MAWLSLSSRALRLAASSTVLTVHARQLHFSVSCSSSGPTLKSSYPDLDLPQSGSLTDHVFRNVHQHKDRVALFEADSERSFTYQELQSLIKRLGSGISVQGLQKGDVVCMFSPTCMEFVVALHGITSIGGILTTCNPSYTAPELLRQLKDSRTRVLITDPEYVDTALAAASQAGVEAVYVTGKKADGCESFNSLLDNNGENYPNVDINTREDIAILPYSSGTTGLPKGVMLTHYQITANAYQMSVPGVVQQRPESVAIGFMPMYHAYGLMVYGGIYPQLGMKTVLMRSFDPEMFLDNIQKHQVTLVPVVPPVALMMARSPIIEQYDLSSMEEIFCAAAPFGGGLVKELKKRFPNLKRFRQGFGMTELSPGSHVLPLDAPDDKYNSIGQVVPNTECKIVDLSSGEPLGPNESGEICVRGPQVMKGYLNNPQATADTISSDGWLHTGDIGYYDEDGYLYFVERLKDLIKFKGLQVAPAELEELLLTHPSVVDAAVIGVEDEEAGQLPKAFIVRNDDVTENDIITFVAENVAPYKKLRGGVEFMKEIPKNPSGKILRRVLAEKNKQQNTKKL